jgi:hypothetical protein
MPCALRIDLGKYIHFEWYVPTVVGRHRYLQTVVKRTHGISRLMFRMRYWTYLRWIFHVEFNNQDARMVEMMKTPPEILYRPDRSIIGWRRLCEKARGAEAPVPHEMIDRGDKIPDILTGRNPTP